MSRSEGFKTSKQKRKYGDFIQKNISKYKKIEVIRGLIKSDKYYLAKDIIDEYFNKYGEDDYINHELAKYYARTSECDKARNIFQQIIDENGETKYYSIYEYAKMERFYSNFDKAEELLKQIINSNYENKEHAYLELAKLYIDIKKTKEAKELLDKIINENMTNKELAYPALLELAILEGDYDSANNYLSLAKNSLPKKDQIYYEAYILYLEHKFISAERLLKNSDLGIGRNRFLLCKIEYALKKFESVLYYIEPNVRNITDDSRDSLILLVSTYTKLYMVSEALNVIEILKKLDNISENQLNYNIGNIYYYSGDNYSAREYFLKISSDSTLYFKAVLKEISMLISENRYEDAYNLVTLFENQYYDKGKDLYFHLSKLFLEKNLTIDCSIKPKSYSEFQLVNYNKELAIDHIKRHCFFENDENTHTLFNENIDINALYEEVTERINNSTRVKSDVLDIHIIPYQNISASSEEKCNYIRVITIHDTNNIITMYPTTTAKEKKVLKKNK